MDPTAVAISVLSASIAFVGLVVSAWAFARSSPAKIYKREQDKAMRKLATQTLLMNYNISLIVDAKKTTITEARRLRQLYLDGELQNPHVAGLNLQDYDGGHLGPAQERNLLRMLFNVAVDSDGLLYLLRYSQELAKRLDNAIEEALSNDLWGVIVQLPPDLRKRAMADSSLGVPPDVFLYTNYSSFRQSLQRIASLDEEALGTSEFSQDHFTNGVIRMVTSCQEYHGNVSSTSSEPLVAALDASNSYLGTLRDRVIVHAWKLSSFGMPHAPQPDGGAGQAQQQPDGGAGQAQQQPARDGGVQGRATTSTAARGSSLVRALSRNVATGSREGSTHLEMADLEQLLGALRDHAGPPQASASTASTSRAALQATPEIRSMPAVPSHTHRDGPASVSVSSETAAGTDASQPPRPQGHLLAPGAESAAARVQVQVGAPGLAGVASDKATPAREPRASGSGSSSQSQQQ